MLALKSAVAGNLRALSMSTTIAEGLWPSHTEAVRGGGQSKAYVIYV